MESTQRRDAVVEPIIPDAMLRRIIDVGQVDVLVTLSTWEQADAVARLVPAVRAAFRTFYPRLRTALLLIDRGSQDATIGAAAQAWDAAARDRASRDLRTAHFIQCVIEHTNDGEAARVALAAADLLQARALISLDPELDPAGPDDVASFGAPVLDGRVDLVAPIHARGPDDGLLLTQVIRPLTRATFSRHLAEPLLPAFSCSGQFAANATQRAWNLTAAHRATRFWIAAEAMTGEWAISQIPFASAPVRAPRSLSLQELFTGVLQSVWSSIDDLAERWLTSAGNEPVAASDGDSPADSESAVGFPGAVAGWRQSFIEDVENLREIYAQILSSRTWQALKHTAAPPQSRLFSDALWAATLADFILAFHHSVMQRDHIAQALLPLYRARVGSFLDAHGKASMADAERAFEALALCVARQRGRIIKQWSGQHEGHHG